MFSVSESYKFMRKSLIILQSRASRKSSFNGIMANQSEVKFDINEKFCVDISRAQEKVGMTSNSS